MKKLLSFFALVAVALAAQAIDVTVADGTTTGEFAHVYGYNYETDQHNQMQYPAAELAGLTAGTEITGLKFYTSTIDQVNALGGTITVSLANIDDVTPWTLDGYGYISGSLLNVDVTAVATVTPAADADGVWTITFDAPFTYTGAALLVDVQTVAGEYKSTEFYGKEMGSYLVMSTYGYAGSKKGQTLLPKVTFTYEGGEEPGNTVATLNEANALEDAAEFTFGGDAVVTVFKNGYLFLRDESGYGMIAGVTGDFENGQVLNQGWNAAKTSVNDGWVRYINAEGLSASGETNADLAAAQVLTQFPDESMLNAYVVIENQEHSGSGGFGPGLPGHSTEKFTLPNGDKIQKTETLWGINADANTENYNVYGVIVKVNGTLMINPVTTEPYVEPEGLRGDVDNSGTVDITDATMLINYLLSNDPEGINMENANCDLSEDGKVDITDATTLINYLLNNAW